MQLKAIKALLDSIFKEREKLLLQLEFQTKQFQQHEEELRRREVYDELEEQEVKLLKEMCASAHLEQKRADESLLRLVEGQKRQNEELQLRVIELETQLNAKRATELEMMECIRDASKHMQAIKKEGTESRAIVPNDTNELLKVMEENIEDESLALINLQQKTNDELQDAQKKLIAVTIKPASSLRGEKVGDSPCANHVSDPMEAADVKCEEAVSSHKDDVRVGEIVRSTTEEPKSSYAETSSINSFNIPRESYPSLGRAAGKLAVKPRLNYDRRQQSTSFHKGFIPSLQTPLRRMHIAYDEQAKQMQFKDILNRLTPQNLDKLIEQVKQLNIDNVDTLSSLVCKIFDKAIMGPFFCEMYANLCYHLACELPDFSEDNKKITFKRLLLNKCQEEFERNESEQQEGNRVEEEGKVKQTEEQRNEKRFRSSRRRMLGNIRLIGELFKKSMLTERIMHECIKKLLGKCQNPDEEDIEALCTLMSTIGEMLDHPKAKEHMDGYFEMMYILSNSMELSSSMRFMLKDLINLRKNGWQQVGPRKLVL